MADVRDGVVIEPDDTGYRVTIISDGKRSAHYLWTRDAAEVGRYVQSISPTLYQAGSYEGS